MWRVVAARDFSVRLRDKGFVISTMITLTVLSVFILLRAYSGGPDSFELGYVGGRTVADRVAALADRAGLEVSVLGFDDAREADAALREGRVDAVLEGGDRRRARRDGDAPRAPRSARSARSARAGRGDRAPDRCGAFRGGRRRLDRRGAQGPASDRRLADPASRSRSGLEGGGRVRGRPAALRAALRVRDLGGHGGDRGEELSRRRGAPVGDPGPATDGGQDRGDRRARSPAARSSSPPSPSRSRP